MRPIESRIKKPLPTLAQLKDDPAPIINEDEERETLGRCDCLYWNCEKLDSITGKVEELQERGGENISKVS